MPRGKYKRTKEIKEKYSQKKRGKSNPNYTHGAYCNKRMKKLREIKKQKLEEKIKSTYLNKEWMFDKYCIKEMPMEKIAELCGVEYDVIWYALKELGIPRITMVGRVVWHEWVEKMKNLKPFKYTDLKVL